MKDAKVRAHKWCQIFRFRMSYFFCFYYKGNRELGSHFTSVEERSAFFLFEKVGTTVAAPCCKYIVDSLLATGKFCSFVKPYSLVCVKCITCFVKGVDLIGFLCFFLFVVKK